MTDALDSELHGAESEGCRGWGQGQVGEGFGEGEGATGAIEDAGVNWINQHCKQVAYL